MNGSRKLGSFDYRRASGVTLLYWLADTVTVNAFFILALHLISALWSYRSHTTRASFAYHALHMMV